MTQSHPDTELARKRDALLGLLSSWKPVAVAFSAGIDSTVVAKAAQLACGDDAIAVTAVSLSLATGEREEAERLAEVIGIQHKVIETREFENPDYLRNSGDRCYFCKSELYTQLDGLAETLGVKVVVNGANLDDRGDYRPGMQAASEHSVRSPLIEAGFTKADVRALAKCWNLPTWDKPATPCLSSRIAHGLEVTPERVTRVDRAEQFLREEFQLREFRVRHEAHDLARLEVPLEVLPRLTDPESRPRIVEHLKSLGFKYITLDLEGFRSGSMNQALPLVAISLGQGAPLQQDS